MPSIRGLRPIALFVFGLAVAECGGSKPQTVATPVEHSLAGLAAQHIVLLPTYAVRVVPPLAWNSAVGRPSDMRTTMDADILAAFDDRDLRKNWIFADDLAKSYRLNKAMGAPDPFSLAEEP